MSNTKSAEDWYHEMWEAIYTVSLSAVDPTPEERLGVFQAMIEAIATMAVASMAKGQQEHVKLIAKDITEFIARRVTQFYESAN